MGKVIKFVAARSSQLGRGRPGCYKKRPFAAIFRANIGSLQAKNRVAASVIALDPPLSLYVVQG
jgi:hypothetical protein